MPGFFVAVEQNFPGGGFLFVGFFEATAEGVLGKLTVAAKESTIGFWLAVLQQDNRDCAPESNAAAGLPCCDEQEKTRLRSHLSA